MKILLEGSDGAGKTSIAKALAQTLWSRGVTMPLYAFPSELNPIGRLIRQYLRGDVKLDERSMLYLFLAENVEMSGMLQRWEHGIVDRHSCISALVYQIKHWHEDLIVHLTMEARDVFDRIYIVDVPAAIATERINSRGIAKTVYEEKLDEVRQRYLEVAKQIPKAVVLDGTFPVSDNVDLIIAESGL